MRVNTLSIWRIIMAIGLVVFHRLDNFNFNEDLTFGVGIETTSLSVLRILGRLSVPTSLLLAGMSLDDFDKIPNKLKNIAIIIMVSLLIGFFTDLTMGNTLAANGGLQAVEINWYLRSYAIFLMIFFALPKISYWRKEILVILFTINITTFSHNYFLGDFSQGYGTTQIALTSLFVGMNYKWKWTKIMISLIALLGIVVLITNIHNDEIYDLVSHRHIIVIAPMYLITKNIMKIKWTVNTSFNPGVLSGLIFITHTHSNNIDIYLIYGIDHNFSNNLSWVWAIIAFYVVASFMLLKPVSWLLEYIKKET